MNNVADPWNTWDKVRCLTSSSPHVSLCLIITRELPTNRIIERWLAEPVKAAIFPTEIFVKNEYGYPTLPKRHQALAAELYHRGIQLIIQGGDNAGDGESRGGGEEEAAEAEGGEGGEGGGCGSRIRQYINNEASSGERGTVGAGQQAERVIDKVTEEHNMSGHVSSYLRYLVHIMRNVNPLLESITDPREAGFVDYLQAPLQPLADNLESATYEVFESDPTKYIAYETAIRRALARLKCARVFEQSDGGERTAIVAVVGAGRGPLVRRALAAADTVGVKVRVFAVEKNPNAIITLQNILADESSQWKGRVHIVAKDMRSINVGGSEADVEVADILVSELLGSFGDNELSPECLDGAQNILSKAHGISIPCSYTSFLAPVSSHKLWTNAASLKEDKWLDSPFVVRMRNTISLADAQQIFSFHHPNTSLEANTRFGQFTFRSSITARLHGFAGYFEAVLLNKSSSITQTNKTTDNVEMFEPVVISTRPSTHTPGMFSWFPLFFPLKQPVRIEADETFCLSLWRRLNLSERIPTIHHDDHLHLDPSGLLKTHDSVKAAGKVWYEWSVSCVSLSSHIHNAGGCSYTIGM